MMKEEECVNLPEGIARIIIYILLIKKPLINQRLFLLLWCSELHPFIEVKNSALSFVPFMFFSKVFKASSGFMSAICLRNTHIR